MGLGAEVRRGLGPILGLAAGLALWALTVAAPAAERVALVIGNSAYKSVAPLANPGNDARAVGDAFEDLGYTVTRLMDANYHELRKGLRSFKQAARGKEVAVVFYAGHGIGVAGSNFLVPVDAELGYADTVEDEAIPLDRLMSAVGNTRHLGLVILDACRNNPFVAKMQGETRSISRGLAQVEPTGKTMVAYAAKHGKVANDGDGMHSPYTEALLKYLKEEPGLPVRKLFGNVHDAVVTATSEKFGTDRKQEPWTYGALGGRDFYLAAAVEPDPPVPDPKDQDTTPTAGGTPVVPPPPPDPEAVEQDLKLSREERRLVQGGLAAAGYDPGPVDGWLGSGTREAIRRWQGAQGKPATGYLDADGAKALLGLGREHEAVPLRRFTERLGRPFSPEWKEDSAGWTDLHYAALLDLPGVVAALCDAGMDADTRLKSGSLPPFGDDLKRTLAALGHEEEFKDWKADGETPLMIAAVGNARNAAAALADCGADVDAKNITSDGSTPLHYAASRDSLDVAKLLLDRGADVNATVSNGGTSLHVAAARNFLMAKLLLDRGADVDAENKEGRTPLQVLAATRRNVDIAKLLLDRGADVNSKSGNTLPPLTSTAFDESIDLMKLFLDRGAHVDGRNTRGWRGWTALHFSSVLGERDKVKLLIEHGAYVNATDIDGNTPLDLALNRGHSDVQALLRESGGVCNKEC